MNRQRHVFTPTAKPGERAAGAPVAHYTHDPVVVDGFVFYTRRVVHLHDAAGVTNFDVAPITLDIGSVRVFTT